MGQATDEAKREALSHLAALQRAEARLYAERAVALVAVADLFCGRDDPAAPYMKLDVALECQVAPATATSWIHLARHLVYNLPLTLAALQQEALTIGQGIVVVKETDKLDPDLARQVEAAVFPEVLGLTPGDTSRLLAKTIVRLDALASEQRRAEQAKARRVWNSRRPDGRALIGGELSAPDAGVFERNLTDLAAETYDDSDPRTADQQRADLFAHLPGFALAHADGHNPSWLEFLTAAGESNLRGCPTPARRRAHTQAVIVVPVETALDLADDPGELLGYGPISGAHARELLATADLRKACTDARTGRLIALDGVVRNNRDRVVSTVQDMVLTPSTPMDDAEAQYRPSHRLDQLVRLRDPRCTGPGCACPSHRTDLDHLIAYPTGPTSADNLHPASRGCHNAKTHGGWHVVRNPDDSITWTSPLGREWTRPPTRYLPNEQALQRPRLTWPTHIIETEGWHHAA